MNVNTRGHARVRGVSKPIVPPTELFLPDLCGIRAVFAVVMIGELLVFVLTLARMGFSPQALDDLALLSLYVQLIGLSAAAALCISRRWLNQLPEPAIPVLSYGLVLLVATLVCELAWRVVAPSVDSATIGLGHGDFALRSLAISAIVAALVLRYFYVQFHGKQRTESEARARIEALQARIRPHFFFNCMNTIASLTRSDPARAERAVEDLADLFRASLNDAAALVTLAEEIELARRYLNIEALRLGPRLVTRWALDALPQSTPIPRLTLQPLLENAIYHGIEPAPAGGEIVLMGTLRDGQVEIEIVNPIDHTAAQHRGNRLAQDNVRQRLAAHFGTRGRLIVNAATNEYRVLISIPHVYP